MGLTFAGYRYLRAGGERSLAERTGASLRRQAAREMRTAYEPVERTFSRREQQIRDLDTKHQADEAAFQSWLVNQQNTIRQEQDNRVAATRALVQGQQAELMNRVNEMADERLKTIQKTGGATAPPSDVVEKTAAAAGAAAGRAVGNIAGRTTLGSDLTAATSANNLAYLAAQRSTRQAKMLEALAEVADDRNKGALQQAADHNRRVAQLLEGEVQKAQLRIASSEFSTKEANDLLDEARDRATTRRGQDVTREGQKEVTRREGQKVNKYGYTNKQWGRFSPSHRQRIIKKFEKEVGGGKKKGTGPNPRQRATARSNIATARQQAAGVVRPPAGQDGTPKPWPPPKVGPGKALVLSTWLQRQWGWPKNLADIVSWEVAYRHKPGAKYPKGIERRYNDYAASLAS